LTNSGRCHSRKIAKQQASNTMAILVRRAPPWKEPAILFTACFLVVASPSLLTLQRFAE
jgi:hypothetical protein